MASFPVTEVAFTGLRFARERPLVLLAWLAVYLVASMTFGLSAVFLFGPQLEEIEAIEQVASADPTQFLRALPLMIAFYCSIWGLVIFQAAVSLSAVIRAVLNPEDGRFAYLRLGRDEVRQALLLLLMFAVLFGLQLVLMLGLFLIAALVTAMVGADPGQPMAGVLTMIVVAPIFFAIIVWAVTRLSLASAMTFDRAKVTLLGSWKMTRGHFWRMFGAYLLANLTALVVLLPFLVVSAVLMFSIGAPSVEAFDSGDASALEQLSAPILFAQLLFAIGAIIAAPIAMMPAPAIYRHLKATAAVQPQAESA